MRLALAFIVIVTAFILAIRLPVFFDSQRPAAQKEMPDIPAEVLPVDHAALQLYRLHR